MEGMAVDPFVVVDQTWKVVEDNSNTEVGPFDP